MTRLLALVIFIALTVIPRHSAGAGSATVDVVYPGNGHVTRAARIFVFGSAEPEARVLVNNARATTYENGAFLVVIPLQPGLNHVVTVATSLKGTAVDQRAVVRTPPETTMPETPTMIRPESLSPAQDMAVLPSDIVTVSFQGSPGGSASFAVGSSTPVPMQETRPANAGGVGGMYMGRYTPGSAGTTHEPITVTLTGTDGTAVTAIARGRLTVLSPEPPLVVEVLDRTVLRESPDGRRLGELPAGVRLQVIGRIGASTKIRLGATAAGWVPTASVRPVAEGAESTGDVLDVRTIRIDGTTQIRIPLTLRLPFVVSQRTRPEELTITVYGVPSAPTSVRVVPDGDLVSAVEVMPADPDSFSLKIRLNTNQQWGNRAFYEGDTLVLAIRRPPDVNPLAPLLGRRIAVDAGHGGVASGAIGPTRLREKEANLAIALRLRDLLERAGAKVVLTRTDDRDVDLFERVALAERDGAEMFLSIHNNALPDDQDPFWRHGTGTYFYHPQSRALAEAIQGAMLDELKLRDDGIWEGNFVVTRATGMPSVLVEIAYVMYPPEEMLLRDPLFQGRVAMALLKGVESFFRQNAAVGNGGL